jgi:hypothetical protein
MVNRDNQCRPEFAAAASRPVRLKRMFRNTRLAMMATGAHAGISRRRFGKLAASGLVAAAIPLPRSSQLDLGIGTYSYHNLTLDAMIAQLSSLKISEIEVSRGEFRLMNHPGDDLFRAARRKLDVAGIRCAS